jgi:DNA-binding MarR family transcriptional regulator
MEGLQQPPSPPPDEPEWLTEAELQTWMALVGLLITLPAALDAQLQRDAGISNFEYHVLAGLSDAPDRTMRMSELALLSNGSLSRLSHVVSRLEKRRWVRRVPDPADGRYMLAVLTDEGLEKVVATAPGHVRTVRRTVFDPLTATQVRQLREIGLRISRSIVPEGDCSPRFRRSADPA